MGQGEQWQHQLQSLLLTPLASVGASAPHLHSPHTTQIGDALEQAQFCLCSPRHTGSCTFLSAQTAKIIQIQTKPIQRDRSSGPS